MVLDLSPESSHGGIQIPEFMALDLGSLDRTKRALLNELGLFQHQSTAKPWIFVQCNHTQRDPLLPASLVEIQSSNLLDVPLQPPKKKKNIPSRRQ